MPDVIRVLLAEDSPTIRRHLASMINETPGMRVVGEAHDGDEALSLTEELQPDVISMDIRMPGIDGLEATRRIMEVCPTPVVVVSGLVETEVDLSIRALQAGALAVVEKPPDRNNPAFQDKYRQLVTTLSAMSQVRVIHRKRGNEPLDEASASLEADSPAAMLREEGPRVNPEIIAIGASAGGPSALSKLLRELPADMPVPIVVVQHMPHEFVAGLARWLDKVSPMEVRIAEEGRALEPGVVNLSPGTAHICVARSGLKLVARLVAEQGPYRHQPAVDMLFRSIAEVCGPTGVGVVLTGMGDDGAEGLMAIRKAGGRTFAQDRASATVYGMPGAALERGAVEQVVSLANLPSMLLKLVRKKA